MWWIQTSFHKVFSPTNYWRAGFYFNNYGILEQWSIIWWAWIGKLGRRWRKCSDICCSNWMLDFLNICLYYLGSLSERITSKKQCIRYKRYTRHKYFHWGNHKEENPSNFFIIVRWSKSVIRSIQQLSVSPPFSLSLSCELESVRCV